MLRISVSTLNTDENIPIICLIATLHNTKTFILSWTYYSDLLLGKTVLQVKYSKVSLDPITLDIKS